MNRGQPRQRHIISAHERISVDAHSLYAARHTVALDDLWEARVESGRQPARWGWWLWPIPIVLISLTLGIFVQPSFTWFIYFISPSLLSALKRSGRELKHLANHTLVIETRYGTENIYASSNILYMRYIERAINKAVLEYTIAATEINTPT